MAFPKGHTKFGGRQKGSLNKATRLAQQLAQGILTDPKYLKGLRARMIDNTPSAEIEKMLWRYAFGEPRNPNILNRPAPPPEEDAESDSKSDAE
jgi:hypothetical protein